MEVIKPPYRVPLMSEISQLPWNGLNIVSTFSGCGGSCLGFKMAGYKVLWANEFVPAAQDTYRANHTATHLSTADIRTVTGADIRKVIGEIDLDVFEGSPPCASFSLAGKRQQGWGQVRKYSDVMQRTDDLFDHYIRLVDELRPRSFIAENVAGLVIGVGKGFFKRYITKMAALPYHVEARLIDAQFLGVPQARTRIIFIGVRNDVGKPAWPVPLPYRYSVRDALPHVLKQGDNGGFGAGAMRATDQPSPTIGAGAQTGNGRFPPSMIEVEAEHIEALGTKKGARSLDEPAPTVLTHGNRHTHSEMSIVTSRKIVKSAYAPENVGASLEGYATGEAWDALKPGEGSSKFFNLIRPDEAAPCPTITASGGSGDIAGVTHPTERRKFSISELRRICGFPDDFVFTGTYSQQWERMGRAVPPPMMAALADALAKVLKK